MRIKKIYLLLFMTLLANLLFADDVVSGPEINTPLEIYGIWDPGEQTTIYLNANSQVIDYEQNSIQYQTNDYDLSFSNQTEDFNLYIYRNDNGNNKNYEILIYFSNYFVPVDDNEFSEGNYPNIPLGMNYSFNYSFFNYWIWLKNIKTNNRYIDYGTRVIPATLYTYKFRIYSGLINQNFMQFNFYWNGYTQSVDKYWDMEAYVKVEIQGG